MAWKEFPEKECIFLYDVIEKEPSIINMEFSLKNDSFVSVSELNEVISQCSTLSNGVISIHFDNFVSRIDIVFVGGLFLLFKQKKLKFLLSGVCGQYHDAVFDTSSEPQDFLQYKEQIKTLYSVEDDWLDFTGKNDVRTSSVSASGYYAPVLYIDENTIDYFFESTEDDFGDLKGAYVNKLRGGKANNKEIAYFKRENTIIRELEHHPLIFSLVFSILYSVNNPFVKKDGVRPHIFNPENTIASIWNFTKQFVSGLLELAKNIVFHSEFKKGIITIRAYEEISDGESFRMLNTYVFDYGTRGIIPTMAFELNQQIEKTKEDEDDYNLLSSGKFCLADLFQKSENLLFRQIRREMAHLGLIHFSALIRSHEGRFSVSSIGFSGGFESYGDTTVGNNLNYGTSFHFTLPLKKTDEINSQSITIKNGSSPQVTLSMSELLNRKNKIQFVSLPSMRVRTREEELSLIQCLPPQESEKDYYVIDFARIDIIATGLFRVLASISRRIDKALIVFNIKTEMLCSMLNSNEEYFHRMEGFPEACYWLKGKSVLLYSHLTDSRFYFADLLFGQNQESFINANALIHLTFPNSVIVSSGNEKSDSFVLDPQVMDSIKPFFAGSALIPFDVLLYSDGETSLPLYLNNLRVLLNKSISIDDSL